MRLTRFLPRQAWPALLALLLGLLATGLIVADVHYREQVRMQQEVEQHAMVWGRVLEDGLNSATESLRDFNHIFFTFDRVSREQFQELAEPLLERYPYIQAISFQRVVSAAQRPAYEAGMRAIHPGFVIREEHDGVFRRATARPSYRVVEYIEPLQGNEQALGLDAMSCNCQEQARARADNTGLPSATGLMPLAQGDGRPLGNLILMPVHARLKNRQRDSASIIGYTVLVMRADTLVEKILDEAGLSGAPGSDVSIYLGDISDARNEVFRQGQTLDQDAGLDGDTRALPQQEGARQGVFHFVSMAGAPWHVVITKHQDGFWEKYGNTLASAVLGLLLSCLAAYYLYLRILRSRHIQSVDELHLKNDYLIEDISGRKRAEVELRKSQDELRHLAAYQEGIREDERKRIAREVHDELGGLLTGIKAYVSVSAHRSLLTGTAPDKLLTDASTLIDRAIETVRRIIADLRPSVLDQLGVWAALEWYVAQVAERTGLICHFQVDQSLMGISIDPERSTMIFRIVQEALTNVAQHANATHVTVHAIQQGDHAIVEIEDNGKGIPAARLLDGESWGIMGMHERCNYFGGQLRISGAPGQGTLVTLRLPLPQQKAQVR